MNIVVELIQSQLLKYLMLMTSDKVFLAFSSLTDTMRALNTILFAQYKRLNLIVCLDIQESICNNNDQRNCQRRNCCKEIIQTEKFQAKSASSCFRCDQSRQPVHRWGFREVHWNSLTTVRFIVLFQFFDLTPYPKSPVVTKFKGRVKKFTHFYWYSS